MKFIREITSRGDRASSKKLWFNLACMAATFVLIYTAFHLPTEFGMDDMVFIWMFSIYLVTVGGFEVIPKMLAMILEFKTGNKIVQTPKSTSTE